MAYKDHEKKREYQLQWVTKRREKYLQGKECLFCSSTSDLMFHHIDPSEKESHRIWSLSKERIEKELAKCIVVCRQCHEKLHRLIKRQENPLVHGTMRGYDFYGCRCDLCRAANAARNRGEGYGEIQITGSLGI